MSDDGTMFREAIVKNVALRSGRDFYVSVTGLRLHYEGCSTATAGLTLANDDQIGSMLMCWNCQHVPKQTLYALSAHMVRISAEATYRASVAGREAS
jgi:hypothetical protein